MIEPEKPRRTGFLAGACHRARRRRDPVAGNDSEETAAGVSRTTQLRPKNPPPGANCSLPRGEAVLGLPAPLVFGKQA